MEYTTKLINETDAGWPLPKGVLFASGSRDIPPNSTIEVVGDEWSIYARYKEIKLTSKLNNKGERLYEVKCEHNKDWQRPKRAGWSLLIQNSTGHPIGQCAYRSGTLCLWAPAGIEIELFNIDPREHLAAYERIVREPEVVRKWVDPRVSGGFRQTVEGGGFKCIPRPEEELIQLEKERARLSAISIPALAQIEKEKLLREKSA